jgi:hypothetical protein
LGRHSFPFLNKTGNRCVIYLPVAEHANIIFETLPLVNSFSDRFKAAVASDYCRFLLPTQIHRHTRPSPAGNAILPNGAVKGRAKLLKISYFERP